MIYAQAIKLRCRDVVVIKTTKKEAIVQRVEKDGNYVIVHTDLGVVYHFDLE